MCNDLCACSRCCHGNNTLNYSGKRRQSEKSVIKYAQVEKIG